MVAFLSQEESLTEIFSLTSSDIKELEQIIDRFQLQAAQTVKTIETITNHDVKAVEYYLQRRLEKGKTLASLIGFIHFGCTSEDINNLSYSLMINETREIVLLPSVKKIGMRLQTLAMKYARLPLLSRTHGQSATPTH